MVTRREFSLSALASIAGLATLSSCSSGTGALNYEAAVQDTWRHGKGESGGKSALLGELVRYANSAPSSHNTNAGNFASKRPLSRYCPTLPADAPWSIRMTTTSSSRWAAPPKNLMQAALAHGLMDMPASMPPGVTPYAYHWNRRARSPPTFFPGNTRTSNHPWRIRRKTPLPAGTRTA